ncbi:hypothetical protein RB653_004457 [Dictyostelium firmibasis]|uniref:DDE Tnp4 domain-containing protein n=1 Tax=Dictyostelium firmibasis TaxID=79012 RepID=A0AAN7U9S1_9MYCE
MGLKRTKKIKIGFESFNDKDFKKRFYFPKEVLKKAFNEISVFNNKLREDHLLWLVDYLKFYTTINDRAEKFNVSPRNFQTKIWEVLDATTNLGMGANFTDKDNPDYQIKDLVSENGYLSMAIDGTPCSISTKDQSFYNGRLKDTLVTYEVGCNLVNGQVIWVCGPFKGESSDFSNFKSTLAKIPMKPGEKYVADRGYAGDPKILTLKKKPKGEELSNNDILRNNWIKRHCIIIENVFSVLDSFRFKSERWIANSPIRRHMLSFNFIIYLHNISISMYEHGRAEQIIKELNGTTSGIGYNDDDDDEEEDKDKDKDEDEVEAFLLDFDKNEKENEIKIKIEIEIENEIENEIEIEIKNVNENENENKNKKENEKENEKENKNEKENEYEVSPLFI